MASRRQQQQTDTSDADEQAMLASAMAATEDEIFREAIAEPEDENDGDRTLEEMGDELGDDVAGEDDEDAEEGELDPDLAANGEEVDPLEAEGEEDDRQQEQPQRDQSRAPSWQRQPQAVDPEVATLRERLARLEGQQQGQRREQPQEQQEQPDPVLDPQGFRDALANEMRSQFRAETQQAILASNFSATHSAYDREGRGDEFVFAADALNRLSNSARSGNRSDEAIVRSIVNAPDPGYALMQWAEENLDLSARREAVARNAIENAARVLGVDPADIESLAPRQVEGQRRQASQQRQASGQQGRQAPQNRGRRLPSLNSAGGSGRDGASRGLDPRGFDGSENSIFDYAVN